MIWQDIVLMVGGFGFAVALVPALRAKEKPPKRTSGVTGGILLVFAITYGTLGLWLAFSATLITATAWLWLLAQKVKNA